MKNRLLLTSLVTALGVFILFKGLSHSQQDIMVPVTISLYDEQNNPLKGLRVIISDNFQTDKKLVRFARFSSNSIKDQGIVKFFVMGHYKKSITQNSELLGEEDIEIDVNFSIAFEGKNSNGSCGWSESHKSPIVDDKVSDVFERPCIATTKTP